jgi:hypothetical protein
MTHAPGASPRAEANGFSTRVDARVQLDAIQEWFAGARLVRSVADSVLRGRARRHLARLDRLPPGRTQERVLLDLVRQAGATRFGRDHDFRRIRRVEDFRRLVPLRHPAELWHAYGLPAFPPPALLLAAHRRAVWTALALALDARPRARLCRGHIVVAGPDAAPDGGVASVVDAAVRQATPSLRPYLLGAPDGDSERLLRLARQAACVPVTCLVGEAGRLLQLLAHLRQLTGRDRAVEVWPDLAVVLYHSRRPAPERARLAEAVGGIAGRDPVLLLEAWYRPEGTLAVEDPHHGLPRLLPDHGVYFEFVPAAEASGATRHGLGEVETGVAYEVALTSPAGWWACRTGLAVRFDRRQPPLLREVEPPLVKAPAPPVPAKTDRPRPPLPVPGPHPRTAGTPAALPGMPFHSPWSAPADRG